MKIEQRKTKKSKNAAAVLLAAVLLCTACGSPVAKATTMYLVKTEGSVEVANEKGKALENAEPLKLYSGYRLDTSAESYAWINLDAVKLTKMDSESEIEIQKDGKNLEIQVKSGGLFFNVTEPLTEEETMTIRTSTTMIGIRGTCGWVIADENQHLKLYLLEGTVEYTYRNPDTGEELTREVTAGESAEMTDVGDGTFRITVDFMSSLEIPVFVQSELENTELTAWLEAYGVSVTLAGQKNPPEDGGGPDGGEESGSSESEESRPSQEPETETTLTMPVTGSEIFAALRSENTETVIVESGGNEDILELDYLTVPDGKTLILGEGISVNIVYPEDYNEYEEKSGNLYVSGTMEINGNMTVDEGEIFITGGTLQVNGSVNIGADGWITLGDGANGGYPRMNVTEGISTAGNLWNYGTIEGNITVNGGWLLQSGEVIGEITNNGGRVS